ncbi:MAG: hypothetical protein LBT83_07655 [Tannerella sp.]|jgi:hypothetical protein|nr:hypothetical protein [Tannerella sp.]
MKVLTTREIRKDTKTYFELAEKERIAVKRGKKYVTLIVSNKPDTLFVSEDRIKEFMAIPMQYRCNPFDYISSGDLFYADQRNIEHINNAIEQAGNGQTKKLSKEEQTQLFGL